MSQKLSIKDLAIDGKKVLVRVDFNVPLTPSCEVADTKKITETLKTIHYLIDHHCKIILISHLGKPDGKKNMNYSLRPVAKALSKLLKKNVLFIEDCIGEHVKKEIDHLKEGEVALLENLRFYPEEENPSLNPNFAKELAELGDFYIDDAFGSAHRAHSSICEICQYFKNKSGMGFLMEKELNYLQKVFRNPTRPFYAIIGGSKISSKLKLLLTLLERVDALFIGGAMAFTFFKYERRAIGSSLCEDSLLESVKEIFEKAKNLNVPIYLPLDVVIAKSFSNDSPYMTKTIDEGILDGWQGLDIGEKTIENWKQRLKEASTVFWNGPLGVIEFSHFAKGTAEIAQFLTTLDATTIVGGGDSCLMVSNLGIEDQLTHVSTGGGASLELIEKGSLPGVEALSDKEN